MSQEDLKAEEARLPDYFPLMLPKCKDQAKSLFECLDTTQDKPIESCHLLLKQYEQCMVKQGIEKKLKLVRAPEPYRADYVEKKD